MVCRDGKVVMFSFFVDYHNRIVWPILGDPFVSQNFRGDRASHSPGRILDCADSICSYGLISISCTILSGSSCSMSSLLHFCAGLLHSMTMWSILSSLSPHNLHLLFFLYLIYSCVDIIIIMSSHQHGYPWPSLATLLYCLLHPVGLQGYIPYRHRVTVCRF